MKEVVMLRPGLLACCFLALDLFSVVLPAAVAAQGAVLTTQAVATGPDVQAGAAALPCVADTSIAAYPIGVTSLTAKGSEQGINAGQSKRLKIKKFENRPILRFDFSQVPAGATIAGAAVEIHMAGDQPLNHVGVYSLHVPWNEGSGDTADGEKNEASKDGACFIGPKGVDSRWLPYPTGDFNKASGGSGGNATCVVRAESLGQRRWRIPVDPYVAEAAMQDGQTLILCDETGIFNGKLSNAFIYSREVADKAPVLKVTWRQGRDRQAPQFDGQAAARPGPFAGSIVLELPHAGDDGTKGDALGYRVIVNGQTLPTAITPRPRRRLRGILLRDLPPGKEANIEVVAYDEAGNTARQTLKATAQDAFKGQLVEAQPLPQVKLPAAKANDAFTITLVDGLTLFEPTTGQLAPQQMRQYVKNGKIASHSTWPAVRGEFLAMQCLVRPAGGRDKLDHIRVRASDLAGEAGKIAASNFTFFREHYVNMKGTWIADVLPVITGKDSVSIPSQADLKDQKLLGIYVDLLVPKDAKPGTYTGQITIDSDAGQATCPLAVVVQDVTLPDELSFVIEMNAYGHSNKLDVFHETYRLCHAHRLSYNVLGYGHVTPASFTVPKIEIEGDNARITDWSTWDQFYGPLLSGEIAKDLPRSGEPATHWYLPFHDGWPFALSECVPQLYEGRVAPRKSRQEFDEWVNKLALNDPLVPEHYCDRWRKIGESVARQFAEHFRQKGWTKTQMQVFDNHKYYFAGGSLSLWTMDEPQYGRDFRSLNWQYEFFNNALGKAGMNHAMRGDISRPELMGDRFDDALQLLVVSSAVSRHPVMIENILATVDRAKLWWYGGGSGAETDPAMYIPLFMSRWEIGCDGGLPVYTALAGPNEWSRTDRLRVVRYDPKTGLPVASVRMKAYRQAQQDMELLNLLAKRDGFGRWHLRDLLEKEYPIRMVTISSGPDDPGYSTFEDLNIARYDEIRQRVVATLLKSK
jgi:hypothetical protein